MRLRLVTPMLVIAVIGYGAAALGRGSSHGVAPGHPGATADWAPADKHGLGTSTTTASPVWFTLQGAELTEIYYPRLDTPSFRDLQFVVTDGHSFAERETDATVQQTVLTDSHSLIYRQVNTDVEHRWRLTKTYITDPARPTVLLSVHFESLTGRRYHVYVLADPALSNDGNHDTGTCAQGGLLTSDGKMGAAVVTHPGLAGVSCGYKGTSDGWTDLSQHYRMRWHYESAPDGNVVQTGETTLTGRGSHTSLTLAIGFGPGQRSALAGAVASLRTGWPALAQRYAAGWHAYVSGLRQPPASLATSAEQREYAASAMVLAASEDKTYRGAYVASPTMPWAWGTGLQTPSAPYHLVWSRDLYQIATALIAEGDRAGALRALRFLLERQQKPDGSFPQNSDVTGKPVWTNLQLDEVADPIILAWQLGQHDASTWSHVKRAADFIIGWHDDQGHTAPYTPQERWENQAGYSPATIASEIAGLVCGASIARQNGDQASATRYLQTADAWQRRVNAWTLTTTGPYGGPEHRPYYLRLTKNGDPNSALTYNVGDSGPTLDQRAVVDPSFLELVRLGIKRADDPNIVNTIRIVDSQLSYVTPRGQFWHRYNGDGYGEQGNGQPWDIGFPPASQSTIGRLWPIFAGERGEYQLAAGQPAAERLAAMAASANDGSLLPEQVWDQNPPSGSPGFPPGAPTFSATPLAWTHAQFIRLAWSMAAARAVEQPSIVACRYVRSC